MLQIPVSRDKASVNASFLCYSSIHQSSTFCGRVLDQSFFATDPGPKGTVGTGTFSTHEMQIVKKILKKKFQLVAVLICRLKLKYGIVLQIFKAYFMLPWKML